jgi:hypothetical protein
MEEFGRVMNFKYRRQENWDKTDLYSHHTDLKMRENYRLTVSTYQTEIIGRLVDHIWEHLNTIQPVNKDYRKQYHLRYFNRTNTDWDTINLPNEEKQNLMEASKFADAFDKKIKDLMLPHVYQPGEYGLPSFDHYLPT